MKILDSRKDYKDHNLVSSFTIIPTVCLQRYTNGCRSILVSWGYWVIVLKTWHVSILIKLRMRILNKEIKGWEVLSHNKSTEEALDK